MSFQALGHIYQSFVTVKVASLRIILTIRLVSIAVIACT